MTWVSIIMANRVCCAVKGIGCYLLAWREGWLTTWPIMTQVAARDDVSTPKGSSALSSPSEFSPGQVRRSSPEERGMGMERQKLRILSVPGEPTPLKTLKMMPLPSMPSMWVNRGRRTSACAINTRENAVS